MVFGCENMPTQPFQTKYVMLPPFRPRVYSRKTQRKFFQENAIETEYRLLTHWGRATHICVSKLTIIGSDNGLSPGRRQAIIWTNAGILLIRTLGTNFSEILSEIHAFSFKKMHLKMSSAKWRLFGLGINELKNDLFVHQGLLQLIFKHSGLAFIW